MPANPRPKIAVTVNSPTSSCVSASAMSEQNCQAEPISTVAKLYQKDLDPDEMVAELGLKDVDELKRLVQDNLQLRKLGLGVFLGSGAAKRTEWDSLKDRTLSTFHQAAVELGRGTPYRVFRAD